MVCSHTKGAMAAAFCLGMPDRNPQTPSRILGAPTLQKLVKVGIFQIDRDES